MPVAGHLSEVDLTNVEASSGERGWPLSRDIRRGAQQRCAQLREDAQAQQGTLDLVEAPKISWSDRRKAVVNTGAASQKALEASNAFTDQEISGRDVPTHDVPRVGPFYLLRQQLRRL